ncbi:MAG: flavodoxin family protein [Nitrospirae bacterium]|nr:flavodoxin family protein [Nitrospirota bacterium]MBI5694259.1 flavodoxin family protein [Nitrospirota bacterium]
MKVLAILGSARRGGNTELLMKEALRGAGVEAEVLDLAELNYVGCQGCKACRQAGADGCMFQDDMQMLYDKMKEADALILGSPVYYGEVTGQMKSFMDRWYALRDGDRRLRLPAGKKALFILVQGADGDDRYESAVRRLEKVLTSYEMSPRLVVAAGLEKKGAVKEHPELLAAAFATGRWLAERP